MTELFTEARAVEICEEVLVAAGITHTREYDYLGGLFRVRVTNATTTQLVGIDLTLDAARKRFPNTIRIMVVTD